MKDVVNDKRLLCSRVVGSNPTLAIEQTDKILTQDQFFYWAKKNSLEATYTSAKRQIKNIDTNGISIKQNNRILNSILSDLGVDVL